MTSGYNLRSASNVLENSESDEDSTLDTTIMHTDADPALQPIIVADQTALLISSLNAIKKSIEQLQKSTAENQRDMQRLREHVQLPGITVTDISQVRPAAVSTPSTESEVTAALPMERDSEAKLYDLPVFAGSAEEWPLFYANFKDTTDAFKYSNRQNLMRLHKCLVGTAKETVAAMLIYPNDVPKAIAELEFRFGRPDILVRCQIAKVQQFPPINENKLEQVITFSTKVRNIVAFLTSAKCEQHLSNPALLEQLVSKMPVNKQYEWARHAVNIEPFPTISDFSNWLSELAKIVCLLPPSGPTVPRQHVQPPPRRLMHVDEDCQNKSGKCLHCGSDHFIANCKAFQSINVNARWEKVKSQQICFSCLRKGHRAADCRSKKPCGVNGCCRYHHPCLHEDTPKLVNTTINSRNESQPLLNCRMSQNAHNELFKILPVKLFGPKGKIDVYAMFDEGSAISILEEDTAKILGLKGQQQPLTLQWFGEKVTTETSLKVNLEVEGVGESNRFAIKNIRTIKNLNLPVQSFNKANFSQFEFLPLTEYENVRPVMLLGLDNVHLGISSTIVEAGHLNPVAVKTKLGWVAYGPTKESSTSCPVVLHVREEQSLQKLHTIVSDYFAADSFGVNISSTPLESEEDKTARRIIEKTTKQIDKGYETGLLWKQIPSKLPNSYDMAKHRLLSIEKKMERNPEFAEKYRQEMSKYFKKNYAKKLSEIEIMDKSNPVWYLPHFGVQTPHKPGKLRIVFDAAATVAGTSLNSILLKGPEQAKSLISILFKFRQGKVAVAADIREMFSQIKIRPEDQHAQRFLWRNGDRNQPIEHYAMVSMIFGAICSPCCAEFIKNHNAEKFKSQHPEAARAIIEKHYVDDFVCSFETEEEAIKICKEVVSIHKKANFELRNFVSNSNELQITMNGKVTTDDDVNMDRDTNSEKILGMFWNTPNDTFKFHTKFHRIPQQVLQGIRPPTKRELLGIVMAIFDPYGLLANFLIFSKVLVQETWKHNIGWDDTIPVELHKKWYVWWMEFQKINRFEIHRCYSPNLRESTKIELHVFVDASQIAFAASSYFRIVYADRVEVVFVAGKTRIAPQKLMSIPRLELQAAVLGVRLSKMVSCNHEIKISKIIFWSDSITVLHWIYSSKRKYKPFVGHRIAEILRDSDVTQWRWTPTNQNAADAATRPTFPPKFLNESIWLTGPTFLTQNEKFWPESRIEPPPRLEEEVQPCFLLQNQASNDFIQFTKFSSFLKLKRTIAWVLRYVEKLLCLHNKSLLPQRGQLTAAEIDAAEKCICKMVQKEHYAKEIETLSKGHTITKQSTLYKLLPYVDESGLLRIQGRIDEAVCLPLEARRPILLPQKHVVSELIMRHFHEKLHHQNNAVTINEVRQKFWIIHAKSVLKSVQGKCIVCKIDRAKPTPPLMGQLPADRLTPYVRPFTYTGVDLFGPFDVSIGRRREKRWAVIFTCLTIRAAHLELSENLSTDAFIICLRNFINRRGTPVRIRSDNGTNFIGAQKELKDADCLLDISRISDEATKNNIEWIFNCPANPSSGGCWERLIRIIKSLLRKTLHEVTPRVETLRSVLIEAENIINSRPLTDIPLSSAEEEPLTPNHFLLGCVNSTQTPHPEDNNICLRKQWRIAQNLKDRLWKRWTKEYLPQLLNRTKWHQQATPLRVNDLVIICEPSQPRSQWKKGRITKVFPAKDGQIRIAEVRTPSGLLRRPATRLATLVLDGESGRFTGEESVKD